MKRFKIAYYDQKMELDDEGEWVRYRDVQDLLEVTPNMVVYAQTAFHDWVNEQPEKKKNWRIDDVTKFRIRYQAMLRFAMGDI